MRRWQPITPAMAAGLTDVVFPTTELLSYRASVFFKIEPVRITVSESNSCPSHLPVDITQNHI